MRYSHVLLVLMLLLSNAIRAQDSILIKLKKELISDVNLPIKIGKVTSTISKTEVGEVLIPELNKKFPLKFEGDIANEIADYISFIQIGEQYKDTINANITKLMISEEINENGDEVSLLKLEIQFTNPKDHSVHNTLLFSDVIKVSDPNVTLYHEYNIRKGLTKALNWLSEQSYIQHYYQIEKIKKDTTKSFIIADSALTTFQFNGRITKNFSEVEQFMLQVKDKKIENRITGRNFVNTITQGVAMFGMISTTIGVVKYINASEDDRAPAKAGEYLVTGIGGILTALLIDHVGKRKYRENIIKRYNEHQMNQSKLAPYNPIKLGFAIPIR